MDAKIFLQGITIQELAEAIKPLIQPTISLEQPKQEDDFITRDEVCELLSITKTTLWKKTKSKELQSYSIGNRVLYKRTEVIQAVKPINH